MSGGWRYNGLKSVAVMVSFEELPMDSDILVKLFATKLEERNEVIWIGSIIGREKWIYTKERDPDENVCSDSMLKFKVWTFFTEYTFLNHMVTWGFPYIDYNIKEIKNESKELKLIENTRRWITN